ncbi:MAG: hypothetical protein QM775_11185 [Pirellulales bacterium]
MLPDARSAEFARRRFLQALSAAVFGSAVPVRRSAAAEPTTEVLSVGRRLAAMEQAASLAMQFRGGTFDEARRWQGRFHAKLCELLGPIDPPKKWESVLEERVELPTHVREQRLLISLDAAPVPLHLLLPRETSRASQKGPAILAIHGHGDFGHDSVAGIADSPERKAEIDKHRYDYGLKLVEQGYVVASPCLTPFGRRLRGDNSEAATKRGDPCTLAHLQLQHVGKLLIAENLRDCLWTLEYLARHPSVDAGRLGCAGLSYGGRMGTLVAALDLRIQIAVLGGAMNVFQERAISGSSAGCQVIPGLLNFGDIPEIAGLIAPRRCIWTVGDSDKLLDPQWAEKFRERQARVYDALGANAELVVDRFSGGHEWHGDVAYPALAEVLRGGRTLVNESLSESHSPSWHLNHGAWTFADGGFRGVEDEAENHGAAARYRTGVMCTDVTYEFDFRLDGAKFASLSINDLSRHLCTVRVQPRGLQVFKDDTDMRGPDKSELAATARADFPPGVWHRLKVSFAGDSVTAEVGDVRVVGKHPQFAEPKENFAFVVAGDSASFRNLRVSVPPLS